VRPHFKSFIQHQLRHFLALDVIPQLASVRHNPLFDRSLVAQVLSDKFELNNLGELVIVQDGCLGERIRCYITGTPYIQEVDSKEFPFGNYQLSGAWN
jgi:hypothetical protein